MKQLNHFDIKCPICGNNDFIEIKKESDARCNFSLEEKSLIIGCTKCHLLLNFNEYAVSASIEKEDENKRLSEEIERLNISIINLEEERKELLQKPNAEKMIEDIDWKIKMHHQELKNLKIEIDGNEDMIPPYHKEK